jgi:hypothetical protein
MAPTHKIAIKTWLEEKLHSRGGHDEQGYFLSRTTQNPFYSIEDKV